MKKMLVSAVIGMLAVGGYHAQADGEVYSSNIVGFVNLDVPSGISMIAPAFTTNGTGTNDATLTLDQVLGLATNNNLRANRLQNLADKVYIYDNSISDYHYGWLYGGTGNSSLFYHWTWRNPGSGSDELCSSTNIFDVRPGRSFWLQHTLATDTNTFLTGEVPDAPSITREIKGRTINQLSNPYPVATTLDALINTNTAGVNKSNVRNLADNVYIYAGSGNYLECWIRASGQWYYDTDGHNHLATCSTNELFTILPGEGFWYQAKSATNFNWTVTKPSTY